LLVLIGCNGEADLSTSPGGPPPPNVPSRDIKAMSSAPGLTEPKAESSSLIGDRMSGAAPQAANPTVPQEPSPFRFADIAKDGGVDFVHFSGMNEEKHFPTANGSGAAIFDYDGDGRMDLYFATGKLIPPDAPPSKHRNRLFRNLGGGKFLDTTDAAGLGFAGYCHGIIVGDIDNDGDQDVFLSNYGPNVLYLNNGNGTFTDISKDAGIHRPGWSSSGAFLDYDNDGDLDLYVSNYGDWKYPEDNKFCGDSAKGLRYYCSPREIRTVKHFFYRNNGNNTFTDVTDAAKLGRSDGHGFGVVTADLNGDGLIDIYVANDMNPNFLFLNKGDGTFHDATDESGAAYDEKGQAQSGMGVDAEDVNGDGLPELFVTNFANEYNTLYQNLGSGTFFDQTIFFGLAADSMPWVGWGCALADFDNDGWPDSFVANGHVDNNRPGVPYEEPALLHRNVPVGGDLPGASRRFKLATRDVGPYFQEKHVARGAAFGDLDDDGDIDIVINHKDSPASVLRNDTPTKNRWIRLHLVGTRSNRDAIGTRIEVIAGGRTLARQRKGGCSLESSNDPRVLIGIGTAEEAEKVTIRWPKGGETVMEHVEAGKTHEVIEPKDTPAAAK
jgi:hypothetical protein